MDANTDRPEREQDRDTDRNGWVVDRKTGRVVRRGSATLATKVKQALVEAMTDGALALDPKEADVRLVTVATAPAEFAEPGR